MHGGASGMSGTLHIPLDLMGCIRSFQWLMPRCWLCLVRQPGCRTLHQAHPLQASGCLVVQKQGIAARTNKVSLMACCSALRQCLSNNVLPCRYREFIADETRRKWEWQCRHEDEAAFWTSVVNGIIGERPSGLHATLISSSASRVCLHLSASCACARLCNSQSRQVVR